MEEKEEREENKVIKINDHKKQKIIPHISVKKFLLGIGILLICSIMIIWATCTTKTIKISGNSHYTDKEVEQAVKKNGYIDNSVAYLIKSRIFQPKLLPFIESFQVELEKPDIIRIHVKERKRAGCLAYNGKYVYFDKNGYALESYEKKYGDVPLVTGLQFKKLVMQEKIPVKKQEIFAYIFELTMSIDKYNLPVQEIYIKDDGNALLMSGNLTIDLYDKENIDIKIPELSGILKKLKGKSGTINMRYFDEYQKITIFKPKKVEKNK